MSPKVFLLALALVSYSNATCEQTQRNKLLLISLDGLQSDYIDMYGPLENFERFLSHGSRADIVPIFPTLTFPCHYSIVTGKYAENHGIVGNRMYDEQTGKYFSMSSEEAHWWTSNATEPLWVTARRQGLKVASYMWSGSSVVFDPQYLLDFVVPFDSFAAPLSLNSKFDVALDWFTEQAVDFVVLYHPQPDSYGHNFGNNHTILKESMRNIDESLGYLLRRVAELALQDSLNIIITSDHGMARVKRFITLERLNLSRGDISVVESGAYLSFNVKAAKKQQVCDKLRQHRNLTVYLKEQIPDRFHYKQHPRIPDVLAIADESSMVAFRGDFNILGSHGYDNELRSMRTVLMASGPDFRVNYAAGRAFNQVDIYSLLCFLLRVQPRPNDGTLHEIEELLRYSSLPHCTTTTSRSNTLYTSRHTLFVHFAFIAAYLHMSR